ncbi:MAG: D-3-phosphoglycerate dehydrogenase (PGDH) [Candidatus Scalindua rubra]|uniref:D-3-phosphoglycerate dehydrogenase (PGDH) n=1 Tax=Candidatus Scalindua rubra TaxID=1872076 RepID=A0A1E3XDU7_9BACT|nr:MAG: D-3-phosphoglycerate dehydrogenase (PGDH) [Candidatus Scalindua rubra]
MKRSCSHRWKVLCNDKLWFKSDALRVLEDIADIDYQEAKYENLLECIDHYDAYFASAHIKTDAKVLERAKRLRVIATPSTGTDHIDVDFAIEKGIAVLDIAKEYTLLDNFTATAEMTWCLILSLIRRLPWAFEAAKNGFWARQHFAGHQLMGKTLGIMGYGRLGKMMAKIGKGFRMHIIAYDIHHLSDSNVRQVGLDTLLSDSDVLTIHIHLTKETRGLISHEVFYKMKPGIIIINTSRGGIIDEEALLDALKTGQVGGAGLDVINGEWDDNLADHSLIKYAKTHENLIITPHIAGSTVESIVDAREFMAKKLADYLKSLT